MSVNHNVNIRYNTDVKGLKSAQTELHKLEKTLRKIKADPITFAGNSAQQIQILESRIKSLQKTIQMLESSSNDITMEMDQFRAAARRAFDEYNSGAVKAELLNDKLEIQHRQRMADLAAEERANQKLAMAEERRHQGLVARTKRALGQSFLEAPLYSASFAAMAAIGTSIQNFIELDKTLTRIGIVTGRSTESMKQFAKYASEAGKALGVTGKNFADASLTFLQQGGLASDYASTLAESSIKLANITGANASDTAEYVTAIANSFKMLETDGINAGDRIADMLASLDAASGSSADEIAGAFKRSASSFAAAGFSAEEASAMIAVVSETTRQSAEMVGTGFKTMLGNLAEVKVGSTEAEYITNQLQNVTKQFGISFSIIDQQTGDMKKVPQILSEVGELYRSTGSQAAKNALIEAVAGKEQRDRFIALVSNQERYNELLATAKDSSGAADEANKRYLESAQAKIDIIKNEWEELTTKILESDGFKDLLDGTANVLARINDNIKNFSDLLSMLASIVGPLVAMKFGPRIIGKMSSVAQAGLGEGVSLGGASFGKKAGGFLKGAFKMTKGLGILNAVTALPEITQALSSDATGLEKLRQVAGAAAPAIGGFFGPVGIGVGMLAKMAFGLSNVDSEMQKLKDTAEKNKATFKEAITSNRQYVDELIRTVEGTQEGTPEYTKAANELAKLAPQLSVGTDAFGNAVLDNIDIIKDYTNAVKDQIASEEKAAAKEASKKSRNSAKAAEKKIQSSQDKISTIQEKLAAGGEMTTVGSSNIAVWKEYTKEEIAAFKAQVAGLQSDLNSYTGSQRKQIIDSMIAGSKTLGLSKSDISIAQRGILAIVDSPEGDKIREDYLKMSSKKFWKKYKDIILDAGEKFSNASKEVSDKFKGIDFKKIDTADELDKFLKDLSNTTNYSREDLLQNFGIVGKIADLLGADVAKLESIQIEDKLTAVITGINSSFGKAGSFFNLDPVAQAVKMAKNPVAAFEEAINMLLGASQIYEYIYKATTTGSTPYIDDAEFEVLKSMVGKNKNVKFKRIGNQRYTKSEAKAGGFETTSSGYKIATVGKNGSRQFELDFGSSQLDKIVNAGEPPGEKPPVNLDGKPDSFTEKLNKAAAKVDRTINNLETKKKTLETELEALEPGSPAWLKKQDEIIKVNNQLSAQYKEKAKIARGISATADELNTKNEVLNGLLINQNDLLAENNKLLDAKELEKFSRLYGIATDNLSRYNAELASTIKGSKEYKSVQDKILSNMKDQYNLTQNEIKRLEAKKKKGTISPEELKSLTGLYTQSADLANGINDFVKQGAIEAYNEALFGTENIEKLQREYEYLKQLTDDILDSHEQLIEKTQIQADIQKEIEESSNQVYKNNLKVVQSNLKNANLTKQGVAALKNQLTLLKALSEASGAGNLRLTRTASGEFRYAGQSTTANKSAAINAAANAEEAAVNEFYKLSEDLFNVTEAIGSGLIEKDKVGSLVSLQDRLQAQVDAQEQEVRKSKLISTLAAKGQINLAAKVTSGAISYKDALAVLDPASQKAVEESADNIVNSAITSQTLLVKSNQSLKEAILALKDYILKGIQTPETKQIADNASEAAGEAKSPDVSKTGKVLTPIDKSNLEKINEGIKEQKQKWYSANKKLQDYQAQKASIQKSALTSDTMKAILKAIENQIAWNTKQRNLAASEATRLRNEGIAIGGDLVSVAKDGYLEFATGGYTGNAEGLAMLHKKELVLNSIDTENMLRAVQILREIPQFNSNAPSISTASNGTSQSIIINADFPNVSSSDEIKKAFESMSSKALQYAYRTKSY